MAALGFSGSWLIFSCGTKLVAVDTTQSREAFVFDCSSAEKKPKSRKDEDSGAAEETGSDRVLAFCTSPSGKLLALTDDSKRLVLFTCEPSWRCISTRFVVRRCTALQFSNAEDALLVADKSGDVYSFSVAEPQLEGELKMGHLSMLLAVTTSPDDRYIISADRDEKIRVSRLGSPYNIQSFCLGHRQFVSALLVPPTHPRWLLSGSGDGTIKLWDYEHGCRLQSCDITALEDAPTAGDQKVSENATVSRLSCSADGRFVAVLCERVPALQFFTFHHDGEHKLVPHSRLPLPHCPLDLTFDPEGCLWVLMDCDDVPLQVYTHRQDCWERNPDKSHLSTVMEVFREHWGALEAALRASTRLDHLQRESFDNVAAYLQKKQQRLQEQQRKRAGPRHANATKKTKMVEEPSS
ncbi:hypothetical protein fugu_000713 [Takifugu bimaculatus]|uniref:Uncharacterized protein n=1 Tax=Takifugu bimaculatus TaxID=433685 RepID=A0A4Z2CHX3_9TELE|nr:hypothetical protein fugu_000713 [Takifugu bimaculatus]